MSGRLREISIEEQCTVIADRIVPQYRTAGRTYSCSGHTAKRWQAAWDGACVALGRDPEDFRSVGDAR